MTHSDCCGAETKVEYRSDHPYYDDAYDLVIPVLICTACGRRVGLDPIQPHKDELSER